MADYPRYELRRIAAYQIINVVQVLCRLESSPLTGRPAVFADARTLTDAVSRILEIAPEAMQSWVTRLDSIGVETLDAAVARVPAHRISGPASDFARAVLHENYSRLIELLAGVR